MTIDAKANKEPARNLFPSDISEEERAFGFRQTAIPVTGQHDLGVQSILVALAELQSSMHAVKVKGGYAIWGLNPFNLCATSLEELRLKFRH